MIISLKKDSFRFYSWENIEVNGENIAKTPSLFNFWTQTYMRVEDDQIIFENISLIELIFRSLFCGSALSQNSEQLWEALKAKEIVEKSEGRPAAHFRQAIADQLSVYTAETISFTITSGNAQLFSQLSKMATIVSSYLSEVGAQFPEELKASLKNAGADLSQVGSELWIKREKQAGSIEWQKTLRGLAFCSGYEKIQLIFLDKTGTRIITAFASDVIVEGEFITISQGQIREKFKLETRYADNLKHNITAKDVIIALQNASQSAAIAQILLDDLLRS